MTTEDIIIHIFCLVDDALKGIGKDPCAKLYPSEVVTIGVLFALKGGRFRAFYRWLKRDYNALFGGLPDRTALQRQLREQQDHTDLLLAQPSVLNVADSYPIELLFPIREGRSKQQVGTKGKDKGRWSIGLKVCWIINTFGQVCGWIWDGMNCPDQDFLDFFEEYDEQAIILADWGFRCAQGVPANVKICKKGTWNDRMPVETTFSLLTVVCNAKKIFHRAEAYIEARLAYMASMFNILLKLFHQLHPDESIFKMSIAEFSL
jgi:hypothetical protein